MELHSNYHHKITLPPKKMSGYTTSNSNSNQIFATIVIKNFLQVYSSNGDVIRHMHSIPESYRETSDYKGCAFNGQIKYDIEELFGHDAFINDSLDWASRYDRKEIAYRLGIVICTNIDDRLEDCPNDVDLHHTFEVLYEYGKSGENIHHHVADVEFMNYVRERYGHTTS